MKKRVLSVGVLLAAVLLAAGPAPAYRLDESWSTSFPANEGVRFVLANASGSIVVEGWGEPRIDVTADIAIKSPSKSKSRELYEGIAFEAKGDESRVTVEARLPMVRQDVLVGTIGEHTSITIRYTVRVPRSASLEVRTINGDISVSGVAGTFSLRTDNGAIAGQSLEGEGVFESGNGPAELQFAGIAAGGRISVRAANGSLVLRIPGDARADVDANAVNGGVHVDLPAAHLAEMKRGRWSGALNGGGAAITLHNVSGEIYVRALRGGDELPSH